MSEYKRVSRADKHTKRQKNKRNLLIFAGLAVFFFIILFSLIVFGNNDEDKALDSNENETEEVASDDNDKTDTNDNAQAEDKESDEESNVDEIDDIDNVEDIVIQHIETTDENVIEAYTGNWSPVETVQEGTHTTDYSDGSDDRKEIKQAISEVTGLSESNLVEHWVGNGGDQKVISTVSNKVNSEYFHIYLSWIENEGWQVTKVERIKQFEKKEAIND